MTKARTRLIHAGINRSKFGELSEPIYLTQGFAYNSAEHAQKRFIEAGDDEYIYARYGNPTVRMFEKRMMALEGAEDAFATASGMVAVSGTLFSVLRAGDHVVAARAMFGSCLFVLDDILPRWGIEVTLIDGTNLQEWRDAMRPNTKLCFCESVSNPTLEVIDIAAVAKIAHEHDALFVLDNVFSTPVFQDSFALGADVVIYSATKHIDGHGRCLGGVVLGSRSFIRDVFEPFNKHTGGALSPFNAWVMLKGLETLALRCHTQADSADSITAHLRNADHIARVLYPHDDTHPQYALAKQQMDRGGTVISFELQGGQKAAFAFINALKTITISNNLGDSKSLITHPSTTTHKSLSDAQRLQAGIRDGLVRLSIGLEDPADLLDDINRGLAAL